MQGLTSSQVLLRGLGGLGWLLGLLVGSHGTDVNLKSGVNIPITRIIIRMNINIQGYWVYIYIYIRDDVLNNPDDNPDNPCDDDQGCWLRIVLSSLEE